MNLRILGKKIVDLVDQLVYWHLTGLIISLQKYFHNLDFDILPLAPNNKMRFN